MYLLFLLFVPLVIGIVSMAFSSGRLTAKKLAVQEGMLIVFIGAFYGISLLIVRANAVADTEIWNGKISKKTHDTQSCCHSYPCNPHDCGCDSEGHCSTCYDTCYEHSHDEFWSAETTNGEEVYDNGCNTPGTPTPERWAKIIIGEPAAVTHTYENYIKANPDTILKRTGAIKKFSIPTYPKPFDYYRINSFIFQNVSVPPDTIKRLNTQLQAVNAALGKRKQLNIIVVVVNTDDQSYSEALTEAWLGGKKNDLVVVIGTPAFPKMAWTAVVTWSRNENMKLAIRDQIMTLPQFNGLRILSIIRTEAERGFQRREMREFEYLMDNVEPPIWLLILVFILGTAGAIGLSWYFINNDPFGSPRRRFR